MLIIISNHHTRRLKAETRSENHTTTIDDWSHLSESVDGPVHLYPPANKPYGSGFPPASDGVALATAAVVDVEDEACAIAAAVIMAL